MSVVWRSGSTASAIKPAAWAMTFSLPNRQTLGCADHSWEKRMKKYMAPDLLIIDDFGPPPLRAMQAKNFYEIVTERHLKSSTIITSYRAPQGWVPLFPDPVMANSALDRLAHHAHHLIMEGDSYGHKLSSKSLTPPSTPKGGNKDDPGRGELT